VDKGFRQTKFFPFDHAGQLGFEHSVGHRVAYGDNIILDQPGCHFRQDSLPLAKAAYSFELGFQKGISIRKRLNVPFPRGFPETLLPQGYPQNDRSFFLCSRDIGIQRAGYGWPFQKQ
jgi:hypothetical protein